MARDRDEQPLSPERLKHDYTQLEAAVQGVISDPDTAPYVVSILTGLNIIRTKADGDFPAVYSFLGLNTRGYPLRLTHDGRLLVGEMDVSDVEGPWWSVYKYELPNPVPRIQQGAAAVKDAAAERVEEVKRYKLLKLKEIADVFIEDDADQGGRP